MKGGGTMEKATSTGVILRKLRGKKSRETLANIAGVSVSSYSKYERDERRPSDEVKQKIAAFYKKSVDSIFFAN
jgi:transcriptional regulator with XRE-family HTH domain